MLTTSLLPALSFASLFLPAASAPTRTHCRCTIYDSSKPWTNPLPSSPTGPSPEFNICSNLGPQLENFRHAQPDLYRSYIQSTAVQKVSGTPTEDDLQPLSTTVLLRATTQEGLESLGIVLPSAPTERPREIVVCYPEPEAMTAYQDSESTLLALQVIVAMVMLACIAEGVISVSDWLERRKNQKRTLRLTGAERLLRAPTRADLEFVFSPGAEKKMQAYQSPEWVTRTPCEKREFTAYLIRIEEEDDDDEMNRPVM